MFVGVGASPLRGLTLYTRELGSGWALEQIKEPSGHAQVKEMAHSVMN